MNLRVLEFRQRPIGSQNPFRWSSIFSGAFATLGFGLFFLLLGNAIGLSFYHATNAIGGLKVFSWIYSAATMIGSFYLGGMIGARSLEIPDATSAAYHGVVMWGFASFLGVLASEGASFAANRVLLGIGTNAGNWLAICMIGFGMLASVMGAMASKAAGRQVIDETETHDQNIA